MRGVRWDLYSDTHPLIDLGASDIARDYRAHCCKAGCHTNYLMYLEEDVTTAVANAAHFGVGLEAVCAPVVESLNAIVKQAYKDQTARGGGGDAGGHITRKGGGGCFATMGLVVLKFDLPLKFLGPMW